MEKKLFLAFATLGFYIFAFSQPVSYDASTIPAKLREGANVIKRYEQINFEVTDIDRATYTVHQVYTILNKEGNGSLVFHQYTNKQLSLEDTEIKVYDAAGNQTNKYRKKDLIKQARMDGLIVDGMYHYLEVTTNTYPVTIEYKYKVEYSGTEGYPSYYIQDSEEGVEFSSYTAKVPSDLDLRYKAQKIHLAPEVSQEGKYKVYRWEAKNLYAFKDEIGSVSPAFYYPAIILAPNKFRHYNTFGEMTTWKAFGQWGYNLLDGLDDLSEERKLFFRNLVKDAPSEREKIALVYNYLQQNFRYVSIQLGIGGVKPFPAKFTDEKKYGDCKGLSFYMLTALKAIGIKSYIAFINSRYNQEAVDPEFPCDRFDHVILCVPKLKDSIWLECTSNTSEFGVLGTFTENRNALLLTENGGVLVPTPKSKSSHNTFSATTSIILAEDGSGTTNTSVISTGNYKEIFNSVVTAKRDDQKNMIVKSLGFKQPDEFSIVKNLHGAEMSVGNNSEELSVNIDLSIEKIPQFNAGSKMFLNPRVYSLWSHALPKSENRKQDYYFESPFIKTDTTIYNLPQNYMPETIPAAREFKCEYATYATNYSYLKEKNQFVSIAKLELKQNRIPADKYAEVKKFFDGVLSDDTQKIIIKKN